MKNAAFLLFLLSLTVFAQGAGLREFSGRADELNESTDIDVYLPFSPDSKIALLPEASALKLTDNLPRLDGATALYPLYSSFVNAVYPEGGTEPSGMYYPSYYYFDEEARRSEESESIVICSTTSSAYMHLLDGKVDIIFCAEPSSAQLQYARNAGVEYHLYPIGIEAFVFFVNSENPIESITLEQVRDIYSGKISNWKTINGRNEKIIAYQRSRNSGSQTIFENRVMPHTAIMKAPITLVPDMMSGLVEEIASYKNSKGAIGYSFYFYTTEMHRNHQIKLLALDGVTPTKENIQSGRYPLRGNCYAITLGNESDTVKAFIEWMRSSQGQYLVEQSGYTGITK
jgi:phosphate transport system substrate-binding protein